MHLNLLATIDPITKWLGNWLGEISIGSIAIRLLLAVLCGGILGYERSTKRQPAGLRTYVLVCVGSTVAAMTNQFISEIWDADASRIGANIITGIGFLGAGSILITSRSKIRGLTTAAALWCCSCIGLTFGMGFYTLGIFAFIIVLVALQLVPFVENILLKNTKFMDFHIEFYDRPSLRIFIKCLREQGIKIIAIENNPAYSQTGLSVYEISVKFPKKIKMDKRNELIETWYNFSYIEYIERT